MKLKNLFLGVSAVLAMGAATTSCTSEMVSPYPNTGGNKAPSSMLVHEPDFYAWSGSQTLGTTPQAYSRGEEPGIKVEDVKTDQLDKDYEEKIIDDYLPEKNENLRSEIQRNFLFKAEDDITFELYPVFCQTNADKTVGIFYYDTKGVYHELDKVFDGIKQWAGRTEESWDYDQDLGQSVHKVYFLGKKVSIPKGYIFGFFWNGKINQFDLEEGDDGYDVTYYSIDSWNHNAWCTDGGGSKIEPNAQSKLHGVTFELEGKTYLGLEDWTDFDYQDLVFTCPENLTEVPVENIPEKGETWPADTFPGGDDDDEGDDNPGGEVTPPTPPTPDDDVCKDCNHKHQPGEPCTQCPDDEGCNHKDDNTDPEQPEQPGVTTPGSGVLDPAHHNDEVEVNFSINDVHTDKNGKKYDPADLWTKLSIHVRKGTDVKICVPLPKEYFCESDDFAILQDHMNGIYTGTENKTEASTGEQGMPNYTHSMTYYIEDWTVTLTVTINEDCMDVQTDGITEELIEYLFEKNGDGINFEIWNYYQTATIQKIEGKDEVEVVDALTSEQRAAFQGLLNKSTIEFLDEAPSFYINAYGYDWEDGKFTTGRRPGDCRVTPKEGEPFEMYRYFCYHLNGTPWNIIWINKEVNKTSSDYKNHTKTPATPEAVPEITTPAE